MDSQEKTLKNPLEDQRRSALEHYEQASKAVHHWSSFVESAIKAYSPESCPPPVSAEVVSHADVKQLDGIKAIEYNGGTYLHRDYVANSFAPRFIQKLLREKRLAIVDGNDEYFKTISGEPTDMFDEFIHPSPSAPVVAGQVKAKHIDKLLNESNGSFKDLAEDSYDVGYNEGIHSPAERIEGDAVDCVYEIDFGGNLKCRMKIVGNKINVEAAMNGWGDGISIDEIKITELKTPHHE
mgnify:CR=1 FL=1